jgi:phage baseplate assembly protein W
MAKVIYSNPRRPLRSTNEKRTQLFKGFSTVGRDFEDVALYDYELVRADLLNHFNIRKGEKLENPEVGTIIWDSIFEPNTQATSDAIIADVQSIIEQEPRVELESVDVDYFEHGLQVTMSVLYRQLNVQEQLSLNFDETQSLSVTSSMSPTASAGY